MQYPSQVMLREYAGWLASARVTRPAPVERGVQEILKVLPSYIEASKASGVPAAWIAAVDLREDDCNRWSGFGQGDDWRKVSTHVPRGQGPFKSKADSIQFYLRYDHITSVPGPWTMELAGAEAESWNGMGPRNKGFISGYPWACTSVYDPPRYGGEGKGGKYVADNVWDPHAVDSQPGIIPVMRRLFEIRPDLVLPIGLPTVQAPTQVPAPQPTPEGLGQGHTETVWIQHSLNVIMQPTKEDTLAEDGSYGRMTKRAVRDFQAHAGMGLVVDGLAGPKTIEAVKAWLAKAALHKPPATAPGHRVTAPTGLRLRAAPSLSAETLAVLPYGQEVDLLALGPDNWATIEAKGPDGQMRHGYVLASFI